MNSKQFANCKLKEGIPGEPCEDDLMLSTRVESISSIKFFNYLQLGDAVFYYQAYRGITRRSRHTDAYGYAQEEKIRYQQTEVFLWLSKMLIQLLPVELPLLKCQKVRNILPIQYHATLGFPVNHIVPISKPKEAIFYIVCLRLIIMTEMLPHAWDTRLCFLPAEFLIFLCCLG